MQLTHHLIEEVRSGRVVLVLGAGASLGAKTPEGESSPTTAQLAKMIADRFLGGQHADDSLPNISDLAISESDLGRFQEYIRTVFQDLQPATFHRLLPTFKWAGLATTNFDLVIERTYNQCQKRAQELKPLIKNGELVEEKLRSPRSVMYMKLHGCITRTTDPEVPLILSVDQYLTHLHHRSNIFGHLEDLSYEHTVVFVGHSLQDPDIRHLLLKLGNSNSRPRYFTVTPKVSGPEERFWESKRITALVGTFEEFLTTLDAEIPSPFRTIVLESKAPDLPISSRFSVANPALTSDCVDFLENDVDYVCDGMQIENVEPKHFYRGFSPIWSAVDKDLDVRRDIEEEIMLDAVLDDDSEEGCRVYSVRGHAGSGKTVLIQRVAWEAAHEFRKLCLFARPNSQIAFDPIRELSQVINERIYLFIDDVNECVPQTRELIERAQQHSVRLTIFVTARVNEWNISCEEIEPHVDRDFSVGYLSPREVGQLLELLEDHNALFRLEKATQAERRIAFEEHAGRQLLVALHEATLGKPFEDIIADEFDAIVPSHARLMYLGICFLNRYDVPVRAGLISRVYGLRFTDFKESLFQPLEGLVFAQYSRSTNDYVYRTRHPHIAEIVVSRALQEASDKLDTYLQIISNMNVDYASDRSAFRRLVRGRSLTEEFRDHQISQRIYLAARLKVGDDPHLLHQMAIYEMNRPNGSLKQATLYLKKASDLAPQNRNIIHSLAELHLKRAESSDVSLEFQKHIRDARKLAESLTGRNAVVAHGYHTLAKLQISQLKRVMESRSEQEGETELRRVVKDAEDIIQKGLQKFPGDSYLLAAESDLGQLLSDDARATRALETAYHNNPSDPFIAARLAKLKVSKRQVDEALGIYRSALDSKVNVKHLHFSYAKLMIDQGIDNGPEIEYQLRRAFTDGDSNFEAQFWYARQLYINEKIIEANDRFLRLKGTTLSLAIKRKIRGTISSTGTETVFSGRVDQLRPDHGFVVRDGISDRIFIHVKNTRQVIWEQLEVDLRLYFKIAFNFWGATAIEIRLE